MILPGTDFLMCELVINSDTNKGNELPSSRIINKKIHPEVLLFVLFVETVC